MRLSLKREGGRVVGREKSVEEGSKERCFQTEKIYNDESRICSCVCVVGVGGEDRPRNY